MYHGWIGGRMVVPGACTSPIMPGTCTSPGYTVLHRTTAAPGFSVALAAVKEMTLPPWETGLVRVPTTVGQEVDHIKINIDGRYWVSGQWRLCRIQTCNQG